MRWQRSPQREGGRPRGTHHKRTRAGPRAGEASHRGCGAYGKLQSSGWPSLSRVLTPGKDSHNDYRPYTHNFASISKKMRRGCPALLAKRLGAYWSTKIGGKSVVVFKSDSHMSQDGPKLPNTDVWKQIISEVQPKLVITTGTAGGIGKEFEVGDVIVSPIVRFDCTAKFKSEPFHNAHYSSVAPKTKYLATAKTLFKVNAGQLPKDNSRL